MPRILPEADVEVGRAGGAANDERAELVRLRRELRVATREIEVDERAAVGGLGGGLPVRQVPVPGWQRAG